MTYCVAMRLDAGLVFLSDTRTNAGVDQVGQFRKMTLFERPGERVMVLLSAGNLGITQAVRQLLIEPPEDLPQIWEAPTMYDAALIAGEAVRRVHARDARHLQEAGIEFNCTLIFGGQVRGERPRLFEVYAAGNFIEALDENLYFQIGELKYGKPILDRVIGPGTTLDEAAKCALISMDSTLRSNLSVGLPLDLLCYEADSLRVTRFVHVDHDNAYFNMIRGTWGQRLRQVFSEIPDPQWGPGATGSGAIVPVRALLPGSPSRARGAPAPLQAFAGSGTDAEGSRGGPRG